MHKKSIPLAHVDDIARSAIFLSDEKKFNGEVYNVSDDNDLDMVQTLKFVAFNTDQRMKVLIPILMKPLKPLLKVFGIFSKWEAAHLRKKVDGKPQVPKIETDTIIYMFGNFYFSNQKIKAAGFQFKYPDRRIGLIDTIKWYNQHGWLKPQR